jgi:predicted TIM-barrel fold metal-dependent hydrolase
MIVDAHVHVFRCLDGFTGAGRVKPLRYGMVQIGAGKPFRLLPPALERTNFPAEILLEYMDAAGVDKAVLMQGPLYGDMNDYYTEVLKRWPDRFLGVALVDPMDEKGLALLNFLIHQQGFRAIKLEMTDSLGLCSRYPDFNLASSKFDWLWETISHTKLSIVLDLGLTTDRSYQTDELRNLIQEYPDVRWIIAHLGQPKNRMLVEPALETPWREQVLLARQSNVWLDLSALPHHLPEGDYPFSGIDIFVRKAVDLVGADRLLWGTDAPGMLSMLTYQQMLDVIRMHCRSINDEQLKLILGENALRAYAW